MKDAQDEPRGPQRKWLSWQSRIMPVWLWHAIFDGTPFCRCEHSKEYRRISERYR